MSRIKKQLLLRVLCLSVVSFFVFLLHPLANTASNASETAGLVNINTANAEQLSHLKGIGPKKAEAIVKYREEHGAFKSIDDLTKVKGIGPKFVEKNKGQLSLDAGAAAEKAKEHISDVKH